MNVRQSESFINEIGISISVQLENKRYAPPRSLRPRNVHYNVALSDTIVQKGKKAHSKRLSGCEHKPMREGVF